MTKFEIVDSGCFEWTGAMSSNGYGQFWLNGKNVGAHRVSYEQFVEEIPDGLEIDHLCRNRKCVNPDHLEPITGSENLLRGAMRNKGKTHCPKGHPYELDGHQYLADGRTKGRHRRCKPCTYASNAASRKRARDRKKEIREAA